MKEVRDEIEIAAPAQRVWDIITDLERYPEWNTFCPRMSAKKIVVGEEVDLDCQMTEKQLLKNEHEVFLAYEPDKFKVCWGTSRTERQARHQELPLARVCAAGRAPHQVSELRAVLWPAFLCGVFALRRQIAEGLCQLCSGLEEARGGVERWP